MIGYDEISSHKQGYAPAVVDRDDLRFFIKAGMSDRAGRMIDSLFDELCHTRDLDVTTFRRAAMSIVSLALDVLEETGIIDSIKEYLQMNMSDFEVSLQSVARAFRLNQSYLSRLFKQKTGVNFVEHLTDLRVRKAMELLAQTDLKVFQIAEKVDATGQAQGDYTAKLKVALSAGTAPDIMVTHGLGEL